MRSVVDVGVHVEFEDFAKRETGLIVVGVFSRLEVLEFLHKFRYFPESCQTRSSHSLKNHWNINVSEGSSLIEESSDIAISTFTINGMEDCSLLVNGNEVSVEVNYIIDQEVVPVVFLNQFSVVSVEVLSETDGIHGNVEAFAECVLVEL